MGKGELSPPPSWTSSCYGETNEKGQRLMKQCKTQLYEVDPIVGESSAGTVPELGRYYLQHE